MTLKEDLRELGHDVGEALGEFWTIGKEMFFPWTRKFESQYAEQIEQILRSSGQPPEFVGIGDLVVRRGDDGSFTIISPRGVIGAPAGEEVKVFKAE